MPVNISLECFTVKRRFPNTFPNRLPMHYPGTTKPFPTPMLTKNPKGNTDPKHSVSSAN